MKDDRLISLNAAINAVHKNYDTILDFTSDGKTISYSIEDILSELPSGTDINVGGNLKYDEWCTDCKEYDQERHSCPRWNRVIRQTVEDVKAAQPVWIPVTEKLPERTDTYLVQVGINENGEGMHTEVRTAEWNTVWQTWYVHTTRCLVGDIIKWMPIPWKGEAG